MAKRKRAKRSLLTTDDGNGDNKQQPQVYAKNSMDRFGDDLCQKLLSYLSFEDRFRVECVSKQFRRTVFASVVNIVIRRRINTETLATIVIKCPNIERLDCRGLKECPMFGHYIRDVFRIFRDNCRHLKQIECDLCQISGEWMRPFAPLVTSVESQRNSDKRALIHCHRLSHLSVQQMSDVFNTSGRLLAKNLITFAVWEYYYYFDYRLMSAFVAHNQSLRSLSLHSNSNNSINGIGNLLSRLPQLRRLFITLDDFDHEANSQRFLDPLEYCHRLTQLSLDFCHISDKLLSNCGKHWPRLEDLSIRYGDVRHKTVVKHLGHFSRLPALQTLTQVYAKNSMDRFGDDLCQQLLSYLSFEDRFRMECVSKQFRKTVFASVVDIDICRLMRGKESNIIEKLATIAIKCPNIERLDSRGMNECPMFRHYVRDVFRIFRDNCRHLKQIDCNLWQNSGQWIRPFAPLITRVESQRNSDKRALIHCHRLSHLSVNRMSDVFNTSGRLLAKNLITFDVWEYCIFDYGLMSAFAAHNQSLKSLSLKANNIEIFIGFGNLLSRLPQLRRLAITLDDFDHEVCEQLTTQALNDSLRTIGLNCKQLKQLSLTFVNPLTDETNGQTLHSLRYFSGLKHLNKYPKDNVMEDLLAKSLKLKTIEIDANDVSKFYCRKNSFPQVYAKNSMDRFGDDLCQQLLSYLSFEDRSQMECVSKQFRRTVFASVVDINIYRLLRGKEWGITRKLAAIAIKCPNIERLDCRGMNECSMFRHCIRDVFRIFQDNCRHLRQIDCKLWQNSGQWIRPFAPLVTRIEGVEESDKRALNQCHRLSHLSVHQMSEVFNGSGRLLAKNLVAFKVNSYWPYDYDLMSTFVAHNQSLRSLSFFIYDNQLVYSSLRDKLWPNCHKHWPRLQDLAVWMGDIDDKDVVKYLKRFSRLPALQTVLISDVDINRHPKDSAVDNVLANGLKLKTIEIEINEVSKFYCHVNKNEPAYSVVCTHGGPIVSYEVSSMGSSPLNTVFIDQLILVPDNKYLYFNGQYVKNLVLKTCDFQYIVSGNREQKIEFFNGIVAPYLEVLTLLDIQFNPVGLEFDWIVFDLWYLDVRHNQLNVFPEQLLQTLPALKVLKLGQNRIRTIDAVIIDRLLSKCQEFTFDKIPEPGDVSTVSPDEYFKATPGMRWTRDVMETPRELPYFFYESLNQMKCKINNSKKEFCTKLDKSQFVYPER
ncbi:unnamed protein product [Medioppia subpectinata]|uniref:F-box domain-containing protein n=1 Tax=Medioppia subpectinata TaxID=1979941 RepID=A0A7R9KMA1_9ACAR|nr:unnamed protein product [Medioppia subpectinata]CAG2106189.1 unnamed protein product [Medioppia subpectinata]